MEGSGRQPTGIGYRHRGGAQWSVVGGAWEDIGGGWGMGGTRVVGGAWEAHEWWVGHGRGISGGWGMGWDMGVKV